MNRRTLITGASASIALALTLNDTTARRAIPARVEADLNAYREWVLANNSTATLRTAIAYHGNLRDAKQAFRWFERHTIEQLEQGGGFTLEWQEGEPIDEGDEQIIFRAALPFEDYQWRPLVVSVVRTDRSVHYWLMSGDDIDPYNFITQVKPPIVATYDEDEIRNDEDLFKFLPDEDMMEDMGFVMTDEASSEEGN